MNETPKHEPSEPYRQTLRDLGIEPASERPVRVSWWRRVWRRWFA